MKLSLVAVFGSLQVGLAFGQAGCCLALPDAPNNQADGLVVVTYGDPPLYPGVPPENSLFTVDIQPGGGSTPTPPIAPGRYASFCFDVATETDPAPTGTLYGGKLYSTCDPSVSFNQYLPNHPGVIHGAADWKKINYLINHRSLACNGAVPTMWEVQRAIYLLFGQDTGLVPSPPYPPFRSEVVQCLIDDVNANAAAWQPKCGDKVAVIFNINVNWNDLLPDTQLIFLEVPCVCPSPACNLEPKTICAGDSATLQVVVTSGTGPFHYAWTGPAGTGPFADAVSITATVAGTYGVTVTDANSLTTSCQAILTVNPKPAVSLTIPPTCAGSPGTITANPSGGTPGYTYSWTTLPPGVANPGNVASFNSSVAGSYGVLITDSKGCTATASATLVVNPKPTVTVNSLSICPGSSGALTAVPVGTGPFTYSWTGPGGFTADSISINVSAAGAYTVTVTDSKGCSGAGSGSVTLGGAVCIPGTFKFSGNSALYGTAGNTRTFTTNGITVSVRAFSRSKVGGTWAKAYLGAYAGGLGVTDGSEGKGGNNSHTVDNVGDRNNYVLFEFSEPVVLKRAFLGYVVTDSDLTVWVGNSGPIGVLSDAILSGLTSEDNLTALTTTRWADLNGSGIQGNVVVIAAQPSDAASNDQFKIELLDICKPGCPPACTGSICGSVLRDCDADGSLSGESALAGWTVTLKNSGGSTVGTATTDANGNYCFNNLDAATYTVVVTPKTDYTVTYPNGCNNQQTVTLTACANRTGINFGYTGTKAAVDLVATGPASATCGQTITYTFTVKNTGNTCLYGGMRVDAALLGGQIFYQTPVSPGQEFTFTKTYLVKSSDAGTLTLAATVTGDPPGTLANVTKTVNVTTTVTCTPPPPPSCTAGTVSFSGNTALYGTAGNILTFTAGNGVQVKVSAFSRTKSSGAWSTAYLGAYSGGLGVTDGSEGKGGNNSHTVDNVGDRNNYVLFEFSQPVVLKRADLGYVVTDSDLKVWIGNGSDPFYNHLTLSDSVLAGLGYSEVNAGGSSARSAALNAGGTIGDVVVIAADPGDATFNDQFKIALLDICRPGALVPPCPSPWKTKDIGSCNPIGNAGYSSGAFTVCGSGSDIWNSADNFRYAYQTASGDCTIVAKVASLSNTDPWAKAGVMIRETLASGSKHASMFVTPGNGCALQSRAGTGGTSANVSGTGSAPYWVKVVRSGNSFKGYTSSNGSTWTLVGTQTISMGSSVYIGLAVTSHNPAALCTAVFQNVTATP